MFFSTFQIWDIERFLGYVEGWSGTSVPRFHAYIRRSHVQRPGPSLGIRIGILSGVLVINMKLVAPALKSRVAALMLIS
jgi:hypothetical protein